MSIDTIEEKYTCNIPQRTFEMLLRKASEDGIQKLVVGAVILNEQNHVLLLVRQQGEFMQNLTELPSGGVEEGETLPDALVREVKEETGLDTTAIEAYVDSFDYTSGSGKKARQFNCILRVKTGDVSLDPAAHSSYQWADATRADFLEIGMSPEVRQTLQKVFETFF